DVDARSATVPARGRRHRHRALALLLARLPDHARRLLHAGDGARPGRGSLPLASALMRDVVYDLAANPWLFLVVGYLFTIAIETPVLCVGLSPQHPLSRRILAGIWLTACTYPFVVLVAPQIFDPEHERPWYLLVSESVAHFGECALFYFAFRPL